MNVTLWGLGFLALLLAYISYAVDTGTRLASIVAWVATVLFLITASLWILLTLF